MDRYIYCISTIYIRWCMCLIISSMASFARYHHTRLGYHLRRSPRNGQWFKTPNCRMVVTWNDQVPFLTHMAMDQYLYIPFLVRWSTKLHCEIVGNQEILRWSPACIHWLAYLTVSLGKPTCLIAKSSTSHGHSKLFEKTRGYLRDPIEEKWIISHHNIS